MGLIYVIDDDEDFRFFARRALTEVGHDSEPFADFGGALNALKRACAPPRLILMDYTIPGLSAVDFITGVRGQPPARAVRVVLVSGIANLAATAGLIGADGFLGKPFDLTAIERVVRDHLNAP